MQETLGLIGIILFYVTIWVAVCYWLAHVFQNYFEPVVALAFTMLSCFITGSALTFLIVLAILRGI